jgi:hypothetical protein
MRWCEVEGAPQERRGRSELCGGVKRWGVKLQRFQAQGRAGQVRESGRGRARQGPV